MNKSAFERAAGWLAILAFILGIWAWIAPTRPTDLLRWEAARLIDAADTIDRVLK